MYRAAPYEVGAGSVKAIGAYHREHTSNNGNNGILITNSAPSRSYHSHPHRADSEGKLTAHHGRHPTNPGTTADEGEAFVSRTLFLSGLPPETTEADLYAECAHFGEIRKITCYTSKCIAFVDYWDIRDALRARISLRQVRGRTIEVQYSRTPSQQPANGERAKERNTGTLYVRPVTTERHFQDPNSLQAYRDLFTTFGDVKKVNCNRKREAEKFVEFHDLRHADKALKGLNGFVFNGVALEVQFANTTSKTVALPAVVGQRRDSTGSVSTSTAAPSDTGSTSAGPSSAGSTYCSSATPNAVGPWGRQVNLFWRGINGPAAVLGELDRFNFIPEISSCHASYDNTPGARIGERIRTNEGQDKSILSAFSCGGASDVPILAGSNGNAALSNPYSPHIQQHVPDAMPLQSVAGNAVDFGGSMLSTQVLNNISPWK